MDDELWYLSQQTRTLREFRADIKGVWNDSVARDADTRYLDPIQDSAETLLQLLNELHTTLTVARTNLADAAEAESAALAADELVQDGLTAARQQWPRAEEQYEQFSRNLAEAQSECEAVVSLIEQANGCCS